MNEVLNKEKEFIFDIYHGIVLSNYIKHWGMPEHRIISTSVEFGEKIYVYYFPCNKENKVARIATIGLSLQTGLNGKVQCEYIFVLPGNLGNASLESVFNYILDIAAHTVIEIYNTNIPRVMPPSSSKRMANKSYVV